jgi:putative transcriptional regulator
VKSIKKQKPATLPAKHKPDWAALDALTDEEIDAQIAADPDVAPDISDWSLDDPRVRIMEPTDVKAIRVKFGLSQEAFAREFGLTLAALRDWEQDRRMPRGPARTLLQIIDHEPQAVRRALKPKPRRGTAGRRARARAVGGC